MKEVNKIVYILAILLFVFNYKICNFFYYNDTIKDVSKWWGLKSSLYAVIMLLVFYGSLIKTKGITRLILNIGVGFCLSNIIDKVWFNVLDFRYNDIIMIIVTVCFAIYNYLKEFKNA